MRDYDLNYLDQLQCRKASSSNQIWGLKLEILLCCLKLLAVPGAIKDKKRAAEKLKIFQFKIIADFFEGTD